MKFGVDFDVTRSDIPKLPCLEILAYPNTPLTLTYANLHEDLLISRYVCIVRDVL